MGCENSKQPAFIVEQEYKMKKLPVPDSSLYENEFEKEAFMTINLIRDNPKEFIPFVREIKGKIPFYFTFIIRL